MMNQKEKKKYKVKFSEEVLDKYNDLPDKVVEEFEKIIKKIK